MSAQAQMIPVDSSLFSSIGYDPETNEFLAQYKTGTLGAYHPTSRAEFEQVLSDPESVGKAFHRLIKPVKTYRKVQPPIVEAMPLTITAVPQSGDQTLVDLVLHREPRTIELDPIESAPEYELAVQQQTNDLAATALSFSVATTEAHVSGQELIISIGAMRKQVTEFFAPMKTAAHAAHKAVCDKESQILKPLLDAQRELSTKLMAFERQVEADRRATQERLRIEAQAAAEAEAKAESERLALEDAVELEAAGDIAGAEAVLANPVPVLPRYVPAPVVASSITRVGGFVAKEVWKARVVNPGLVPREWMLVDLAALNKHAANRKSMAIVPGVEFFCETTAHGRSR